MSFTELFEDENTLLTIDVDAKYDTNKKIMTKLMLTHYAKDKDQKIPINCTIKQIKAIPTLSNAEKSATEKLSSAFTQFIVSYLHKAFVEVAFDFKHKPSLNLVLEYDKAQVARYPILKIQNGKQTIEKNDISNHIVLLMKSDLFKEIVYYSK